MEVKILSEANKLSKYWFDSLGLFQVMLTDAESNHAVGGLPIILEMFWEILAQDVWNINITV